MPAESTPLVDSKAASAEKYTPAWRLLCVSLSLLCGCPAALFVLGGAATASVPPLAPLEHEAQPQAPLPLEVERAPLLPKDNSPLDPSASAVLLFSEELEEILALADRVAVLFEGRIMG